MAKYRVITYADNERGIGAVVEKKSFFKTSIWIKMVDSFRPEDENWDIWVNKETGESGFACISKQDMDNFYKANALVKE